MHVKLSWLFFLMRTNRPDFAKKGKHPANISTLFQGCLLVGTTSRSEKMSNQRWNNVAYFNFGIYNVEQRWINVVYFNVDMNNVRQRRNNVVIFNVEFHNVDQRRNNVVKMTISKKNRKIIWNWINWILSFNNYFIFLLILLPMLGGICWRKLAKPPKFLKVHEKNCITRT